MNAKRAKLIRKMCKGFSMPSSIQIKEYKRLDPIGRREFMDYVRTNLEIMEGRS